VHVKKHLTYLQAKPSCQSNFLEMEAK